MELNLSTKIGSLNKYVKIGYDNWNESFVEGKKQCKNYY